MQPVRVSQDGELFSSVGAFYIKLSLNIHLAEVYFT
jgi:hypothetical protein